MVNANTADVRVAPPLEFLTAKMMVEIIDIDDPMELAEDDVNRFWCSETYSRISCVLKTSLNMANQRSTAMQSRNHFYTSKVPMRSADYGDESTCPPLEREIRLHHYGRATSRFSIACFQVVG